MHYLANCCPRRQRSDSKSTPSRLGISCAAVWAAVRLTKSAAICAALGLTGLAGGPSVHDVMAALGREESLARIARAARL